MIKLLIHGFCLIVGWILLIYGISSGIDLKAFVATLFGISVGISICDLCNLD